LLVRAPDGFANRRVHHSLPETGRDGVRQLVETILGRRPGVHGLGRGYPHDPGVAGFLAKPQRLQHVKPIVARQSDVEDDDVRTGTRGRIDRARNVREHESGPRQLLPNPPLGLLVGNDREYFGC
jgi:hypothetical protein